MKRIIDKVTDDRIKDWFGHNSKDCHVKIVNKQVYRKGSPDPLCRSTLWHWVGSRDEIAIEILAETERRKES